jgi:hypothetical protein
MMKKDWIRCPKCETKTIKRIEELREKIKKKYGKMLLEEFNLLQKELKIHEENCFKKHLNYNTMYEEFINYLEDDTDLYIHYFCKCMSCNFEKKYEKTIKNFIKIDKIKTIVRG